MKQNSYSDDVLDSSTYPVLSGLGQQSVARVADSVQCCKKHVPEAVKERNENTQNIYCKQVKGLLKANS